MDKKYKPKQFHFNISLSVLNHLGRNLYRSFATVLGEAISNSWDADATNVHIVVDKESNSRYIRDDGHGMTDNDFQDRFLRIGYSKRKQGTVSPEGSGRSSAERASVSRAAVLREKDNDSFQGAQRAIRRRDY